MQSLKNVNILEEEVIKCARRFVRGHRNVSTLESDLVLLLMKFTSNSEPEKKPESKISKKQTKSKKNKKIQAENITKEGFDTAAMILFDREDKKIPLEEFYQTFCALMKADVEDAYVYATYMHCCGFATFDNLVNPSRLIINYPPIYGCPMDDSKYHSQNE